VRVFSIPFVTLVLLLCPALVRAGEKDPNVEACAGKTQGATCARKKPIKEEGADLRFETEPGTCQSAECCELDYSQGSPPKTTCAPCLECKPGGPDVTPPSTDDGGGAQDVEPPHRGNDEPPATSPGKKGCAVGGASDVGGLGVLLLVFGGRARARARARG